MFTILHTTNFTIFFNLAVPHVQLPDMLQNSESLLDWWNDHGNFDSFLFVLVYVAMAEFFYELVAFEILKKFKGF